MLPLSRRCEVCGEQFKPRAETHRFDSATCRSRARRAQLAGKPIGYGYTYGPAPVDEDGPPAADPQTGDPGSSGAGDDPGPLTVPEAEPGLVASVRETLEAANVAESFAGQLAITLAKRLASPDESGVSALSKELRTVMAAALEGVTPPPAAGEDEPAEDGVSDLKERRDRKARQAADRAGLLDVPAR